MALPFPEGTSVRKIKPWYLVPRAWTLRSQEQTAGPHVLDFIHMNHQSSTPMETEATHSFQRKCRGQQVTGLHWWLSGKESACNAGGKIPLGEEMATHSNILAWEISQRSPEDWCLGLQGDPTSQS